MLSLYLGSSERFRLNLQARYDPEDRLGAELEGIRPLSAGS